MQLKRLWLGIFLLLLIPFLPADSFAQGEDFVSVDTEKGAYAAGEKIVVFGQVSTKIANVDDVALRVVSPNGTIVHIDQVTVDSDNNFSTEISTSIGGNWQESGVYKILANYYNYESESYFEYGGMMSAGTQQDLGLSQIEADATDTIMIDDHDVPYELTGAKILRITPDVEMKALVIEIETYSDGILKITFPKEVIDSTDPEGFFVIVDGEEANHDELLLGDYWTFSIPFVYGSENIEIIGTYVIPEFGTIAMMVLAVSIVAIVLLSSKSKLNLIPKV